MLDGDKLIPTNKALNERLDVRFALKAAQLGVWELDLVNKTVIWDERCRELFGLSTDTLLTYEEATRYIHPEDKPRVDAAIDWAINPKSGGEYDITYRTIGADDGLLRRVRFIGQVYFDELGNAYRFSGIAQDMTADIKTQQIAASEQRFRTTVEQAPVAMALFSGPQFVITLANERVLEYWGRQREQVMNKPLFEALPEASGQGFEELLTGVYTTGKRLVAKELPVLLERSGQIERTYIDFVYEPFREPDGSICGVTVVCFEVTDQVIARKRIEEKEAKFRLLIEEAPVATCLFVGPELVIELANQPMLKFWGKGDAVLGKPLAEALPELADQPFLQILETVFKTGIPYHSTADPYHVEVNGVMSTYYFNFTYKPLFSEDGSVYAIMNMAVDVTEQVLAGNKLLQ
ncbi:MAG TPA: PAS domain-containing protein, partial [Fibrella sp.]